jgi:hypothetical protein
MNLQTYGGRRFILTVGSGLSTVILVACGLISDQVYATVTIATVATYIVGNTTQKVVGTKPQGDSE